MRTLLLVMVLGLAVLGCGNGESASQNDEGADDSSAAEVVDDDGIVGTWKVIEVLSGDDISNTGVIYEFNNDGTMQSRSGAIKIDGTWSVAGDTLKQVIGGVDMDVLFSFDGDNLVYDIINGPQTFLLEKQ